MGEKKASATETRDRYPHFLKMSTRWNDNDAYGHVNNAIYYEYFDAVINEYLIRVGQLDPGKSSAIAYCVENMCQYHRALGFPETFDAGLRVGKLGNSSVRYEIGLFSSDQQHPAATGYFVHVFVDRETTRPVPMPTPIRSALEKIVVET